MAKMYLVKSYLVNADYGDTICIQKKTIDKKHLISHLGLFNYIRYGISLKNGNTLRINEYDPYDRHGHFDTIKLIDKQ